MNESVVVTGATGHLGNVLLRRLAAIGCTRLRALVRPGGSRTSIADLEVEVTEADVRSYDSLVAAFAGADVVFHLAGIVSISGGGYNRLRETNVEGTRNVVAAGRKAGIRRMVYASSVHAFAEPPPGTCLLETDSIDPARVCGPYAKTKAEATLLVGEAAQKGLDAVIVFPSGIIGPYDFRPSHTGELIRACCQGRLKAYVRGAYNFVDVRDVAEGLIAAAMKGRQGEGYILAGYAITVENLLRSVELATGTRAPDLCLPFGLVRAMSPAFPAYYRITKQRPLFTKNSLDIISSNSLMSHDKAARELAFSPRPLEQTIRDTTVWLSGQGML